MALADIPGLFIPRPFETAFGQALSAAVVVDASGEKAAFVVFAPKTGLIRKVHFRTAALTTATDTDVRIETVSLTDGHPTGTLWGANTNVTVASASITATTYIVTGALTADASVTMGDQIAVVIAPTGTPNYQIAYYNTGGASGTHLQYIEGFTASWAKIASSAPLVALEYSDGTFAYMPGVYAISAVSTTAIGTGSTPDEMALKFTFPGPVRVSGFWFYGDMDGDTDIVLYGADGTTALATKSLDKDARSSTGTYAPITGLFNSTIDLTSNTAYRLAVKPSSATTMTLYSFTVNSAAVLDQFEGGQNFHLSTRTDAGAWTDTTTQRPWVGLIIDGIDDGVSAGGAAQFRMGSVG